MIGMLYQKLKPDPDEPAFASFEFKTYASNAYIVVTGDMYEDQAQAMFGMVSDQAGPILNSNNSLHVEIDTGRNAGEILGPNMSQMLTESALFKIVFTHDPTALVSAREIVNAMGMDKKISRALAYAALYSGSSIKLNFKSGTNLPESAKSILDSLSAAIPPLDQVLPPEVTTFAHGVFEHAGHEVFINLFAGSVAKEIHLSLKGGSQIFQLN